MTYTPIVAFNYDPACAFITYFITLSIDEDSVLWSADYQITGRHGEYFKIKAVRYHNINENGTRFKISTIDSTPTQHIELDVPDKFIHSHFIKNFIAMPSSATSTATSNGVQVQDGTFLTETDKINILISHFEFQPNKVCASVNYYYCTCSLLLPILTIAHFFFLLFTDARTFESISTL